MRGGAVFVVRYVVYAVVSTIIGVAHNVYCLMLNKHTFSTW